MSEREHCRCPTVSLREVLQHLDVKFLVSDDLLQPTVLIFELFQTLRFLALHPTVLLTPAMIRGLGEVPDCSE